MCNWGLQHDIHPHTAEEGVIAGVLGNTDVILVAYGQLVETRVIVTNTPKALPYDFIIPFKFLSFPAATFFL